MPQKNAIEELEQETVCQQCLEREMGNWLEEEPTEELMELADRAFGYYFDHDGKCAICGKASFSQTEFYPETRFDCLSEELEGENFQGNLTMNWQLMLN